MTRPQTSQMAIHLRTVPSLPAILNRQDPGADLLDLVAHGEPELVVELGRGHDMGDGDIRQTKPSGSARRAGVWGGPLGTKTCRARMWGNSDQMRIMASWRGCSPRYCRSTAMLRTTRR